MTRRIVLATRNEHKVEELRDILGGLVSSLGLDIVAVTQYPDVPEVAESEVTFAGNAMLKARVVAEATGLPALADDSGLAVHVLGGSPGVFSARWSGRGGHRAPGSRDRANRELLLDQLADVPDEHRGAAFVCAAALALPGAGQRVVEGRLTGQVSRAERGSNGFGYDPIFVPDGGTRTLAEFSATEKNAVSHRARAFRALAIELSALLDLGVAEPPPRH